MADEKAKTQTKKPARPWDKKRVAASTKTQKEKTARLNAKAERITQERRQGKPLKYDSSKLMAYKIADYFSKCDNTVIDTEKIPDILIVDLTCHVYPSVLRQSPINSKAPCS